MVWLDFGQLCACDSLIKKSEVISATRQKRFAKERQAFTDLDLNGCELSEVLLGRVRTVKGNGIDRQPVSRIIVSAREIEACNTLSQCENQGAGVAYDGANVSTAILSCLAVIA